jgi:hypothetical protein
MGLILVEHVFPFLGDIECPWKPVGQAWSADVGGRWLICPLEFTPDQRVAIMGDEACVLRSYSACGWARMGVEFAVLPLAWRGWRHRELAAGQTRQQGPITLHITCFPLRPALKAAGCP